MSTQFTLGQWIKKTLFEGTVILVASATLALGINLLRENRLPLFQSGEKTAVQNGGKTNTAALGVYEISFAEALAHFRAHTAVFVDARSPEAYRQGHIPGAANLPDQQFDDFFGPFFEEVDPERVLITYCAGEQCALSASLTEKLRDAGYEKVFVLEDGWGQWRQRNLPVETEP